MRRFFVDPAAVAGEQATLGERESRHVVSVLRLGSGTEIELFDGTGVLYRGRIQTDSRQKVTVRILSSERVAEPGRPLTLMQGLLKGKKMDFLVQKATELGVQTLQPLLCRYSERQRISSGQLDRWHRIMLEACKQSRRIAPMTIAAPVSLKALDLTAFSTGILFWEGERAASITPDLLGNDGPTGLVFGPEGGLHDDEVAWFKEAGFHPVSLGRQTLRAETAALAGTAIIRFLTGGFYPPGAG